MQNLKDHWGQVRPGWRHFVDSMPTNKQKRIIDRVQRNLFDFVNWDEVQDVLDYGVGGGLLAKHVLSNHTTNLKILDISAESLEKCKDYVGADIIKYSDEIPDDLSSFIWEGGNVDLLYCNEVIQHFPSFEYFQEVATLWQKGIKPNQLAFQVKLSSTTKECQNYSSDFLNGLLLSKEDVLRTFDGKYSPLNFTTEKSPQGQYLGYFTFERK